MITDQAIATEEAINAGLTEMTNFWYRVIIQSGSIAVCHKCYGCIVPGSFFKLARVKTRTHRYMGKIHLSLAEAHERVVILCRQCDPVEFTEDECRIADKFKNKTTENCDIT